MASTDNFSKEMAIAMFRELQVIGFTKSSKALEKEILKRFRLKSLPSTIPEKVLVLQASPKSDVDSSDGSSAVTESSSGSSSFSSDHDKSKTSKKDEDNSGSSSSDDDYDKAIATKNTTISRNKSKERNSSDSSSSSSDSDDEKTALTQTTKILKNKW